VEEQTATTGEMVRSVTGAADGTRRIDDSISGLAASARHTLDSADEARRSAAELAALARTLTDLVGQFDIGEGIQRGHIATTGRAAFVRAG
jgi:methyl-accepting chemotaxis protein